MLGVGVVCVWDVCVSVDVDTVYVSVGVDIVFGDCVCECGCGCHSYSCKLPSGTYTGRHCSDLCRTPCDDCA